MTFDAARPRYSLPLAGKTYELVGTMELIETVEYVIGRGITQVALDVIDAMPSSELAKLLSSVLSTSSQKLTIAEAKDLLWNTVGLSGDDNKILRVHLYSFLSICIAPPEKREAKAKTVGELIGKLSAASLGESTSSSASAS